MVHVELQDLCQNLCQDLRQDLRQDERQNIFHESQFEQIGT